MRSHGDPSPAEAGRLAEATRIATLLTADPVRGPLVAREALDDALQLVPPRRREARLGDALLAQLVRRSRTDAAAPPEDLPEQLAALHALPRRGRAALVLRHYADLTDERAAFFLDCSARTVTDLVDRAVRALPAEARTDVHEWLDSIPLPRPTALHTQRTLLRRILTPRLLRLAGAVAAIALGVVAGLRLPGLFREPEPPTRQERLAEIRRVVELREASLPFDPDDAGPGSSPMFPVVDGVVGGNLWSVSGYRDRAGSACLQLVVAYDFGRRRCLGPARRSINAIVDVDRDHGATFISGTVAPGVETLHFVGPGVSWMDVTIGRQDERSPSQPGFFGIALGEEYVAVDSREAARDGGYEVLPGKLTAMDANGRRVAKLSVFLARA